ncbi:MAG: acyl-CoA thioesterase [bacterium]|nr:acyl-CoA thioesterase [bacterium]
MERYDPRPVSSSAMNDQSYIVMPTDMNIRGTMYGGQVMKILDSFAATVAMRHSERMCVTLSADEMRFLAPAYLGEELRFQIAVNRVWGTSMEIGAKVSAYNLLTGEQRHVVSAYFTFVALDENGISTRVRRVLPETNDEARRYHEADVRRAERLEKAKRKKGA